LSQLHLVAFIKRNNTAWNMMVIVKHTAKSAANQNSVDVIYDVI